MNVASSVTTNMMRLKPWSLIIIALAIITFLILKIFLDNISHCYFENAQSTKVAIGSSKQSIQYVGFWCRVLLWCKTFQYTPTFLYLIDIKLHTISDNITLRSKGWCNKAFHRQRFLYYKAILSAYIYSIWMLDILTFCHNFIPHGEVLKY